MWGQVESVGWMEPALVYLDKIYWIAGLFHSTLLFKCFPVSIAEVSDFCERICSPILVLYRTNVKAPLWAAIWAGEKEASWLVSGGGFCSLLTRDLHGGIQTCRSCLVTRKEAAW